MSYEDDISGELFLSTRFLSSILSIVLLVTKNKSFYTGKSNWECPKVLFKHFHNSDWRENRYSLQDHKKCCKISNMNIYFNIIYGRYFRRISSFCFILVILRRVSIFSSIAIGKTFKIVFGTIWVSFRNTKTVILGNKQNDRQIQEYTNLRNLVPRKRQREKSCYSCRKSYQSVWK